MPKTIVVIPTYNEADNLPKITAEILGLGLDGLELLVVDDNSPDGTGQIADELCRSLPGRFQVLHRSGKQGLGTAYIQGFKQALQNKAELVIQMDADFSHSPRYLPEMLAQILNYDLVVGSRYVAGGRVDDRWGWDRRFLSWWANSVWVHFILGAKTKDGTAGFKCWRADTLRRILELDIRSNGYVFQVEMIYLAERLGYRIKEIPIYFEDRRLGQSKMSFWVNLEAALRVIQIGYRHRRIRPIHFQ